MGVNKAKWVDFYRQIFLNHLNNSATFAGNLPFMTAEEQQRFLSSGNREEAVTRWLETLEPKQNDDGILQQVIDALKASGQQHIASWLEEGKSELPIQMLQERQKLVRIFQPELVKVSPIQMVPYLMCLSDEEKNEIQACKDLHGDEQAAMKMVFYLLLKGPEMYGQLVNALSKAKHEKLSRDLETMIGVYDPTSDKDLPAIPDDKNDKADQGQGTAPTDKKRQVNNMAATSASKTGTAQAENIKRDNNVAPKEEEASESYGQCISVRSPEHNKHLEAGPEDPPSSLLSLQPIENAGGVVAQGIPDVIPEDPVHHQSGPGKSDVSSMANWQRNVEEEPVQAQAENNLSNSAESPSGSSGHESEPMGSEGSEPKEAEGSDPNGSERGEPDGDASSDLPKKELELRDYQLELAQPALPGPDGIGKNTITVAPTGSGKTIVALKVAMDFLTYTKNSGEGGAASVATLPSKVVFLVNQVALVEQQSKLFTTYLGTDAVIALSGETAHGPLKPILEKKSVLVMTAQILVNGLVEDGAEERVDLSDIGLLILDECHNCQKNTPYNKIMAKYRDMKLSDQYPRPQIFGMTASLDIGQAKSQYQAESKILQLLANLDAEVLSTVHTPKCLEELEQHQNIPTEAITEVAGRSKDPYAEEINTIMEKIEKLVECTADWKKLQAYNPQLKIPSSRGTQTYEQWVVQMQDGIAVTVTDKAERRKLMTCTDHLKVYNDSLYINRDIRTIDALSHLTEKMEEWNKHKDDWSQLSSEEKQTKENPVDETDEFVLKLFNERKTKLEEISKDPNNKNPVLEKLGEVLLKAFETTEEVDEKRGILFAKTRASTDALKNWIEETDKLKWLKPGKLIGSGGSGGMTQTNQIDLLKQFREGGHKLIVATSVAQEGLDIQACNVVVRYNHISSVVGHVQARGRNRAKGGQFFLVVDEQLKLGNKNLMNLIREDMMRKATETIQKKLTEFQTKIRELQREDQVDRRLKNSQDVTKKQSKVKSRVKLTCRKCGELACHSNDIRTIKDAHHIVINDEFHGKYDTKENPRFPLKVDDFNFQKNIICMKCKSEWGTIGMYKGIDLPILKIAGFIVEYKNGKQQRTKKWKDVFFKVEPITPDDLEKIFNVSGDEEEEEGDEEDSNGAE